MYCSQKIIACIDEIQVDSFWKSYNPKKIRLNPKDEGDLPHKQAKGDKRVTFIFSLVSSFCVRRALMNPPLGWEFVQKLVIL